MNSKRLVVMSESLLKYNIAISGVVALRVNLAWYADMASVKKVVDYYEWSDIFLDLPMGRKKPPNFSHDMEKVIELVSDSANIKYVAVSNIENAAQVKYYQTLFKAQLVPKIETYMGVRNADQIVKALDIGSPTVMLDHQDLFSDLVGMGREGEYLNLVEKLERICEGTGTCLLRTVGVVFSEWAGKNV